MYTMRGQHFLLWAADQNCVRIEKTDSGGLWHNLQKELLKFHHFTFSRAAKGEISNAVPVCACSFFFFNVLGQWVILRTAYRLWTPKSHPSTSSIRTPGVAYRHWQFSFKERFLFERHTQVPVWHLRTIWDMFQHSWLLSLPILCHRRVYLF